VRFARNPEYASFRAIVIDTAPTGHTLRLLTLPDFLDSGVGKLVRLRVALAGTLSKVTSFFSPKSQSGRAVDAAMDKLKELQVR
jgi:arsenite/tail-anchored protein-transporting ATPase